MNPVANVLPWYFAFYDDLATLFPGKEHEVRKEKKFLRNYLNRFGLPFLTQMLPRLHQEALEALERSDNPPDHPHLRWLLEIVWENPGSKEAAHALRAHRQLSHALYKHELPYSDEDKNRVISAFISTEEDVLAWEESARTPNRGLRDTISRAAYYLSQVFGEVIESPNRLSEMRCLGQLTPKHGPGSVATGEQGDDKWRFKRLYRSLHARFPYYDWFVCRGVHHLLDRIQWYRSLERLDHPCAKVVLVPKDSRGPRLISEEPLELQFMQQAYFKYMVSRSFFGSMAGHVLFDDQSIHRSLALESSRSLSYATLDLKEASDRVSCSLVNMLFPEPIAKDLMALRSHETLLPNGRVLPLHKFAPMGSSVCFPTLAFVAWGVVRAALENVEMDAAEAVDKLPFIFGDDVIVPGIAFDWVIHCLELVGLKVNRSKSFTRSFFRESCGMDAYFGIDITPVRVRTLWDHRSRSARAYLSYISHVNNLRDKCWFGAADALLSYLENAFGRIPRCRYPDRYPSIVEPDCTDLQCPTRWSKAQSAVLALVPVPCGTPLRTRLNGWERLYSDLTQGRGEAPDLVTRRGAVKMQRKWIKTYP